MNAAPLILVCQEKCRGCRRCEVACARLDSPPFNPRRAGVHIMKLDNGGIDYPVLNAECTDRFCGKTLPGQGGENEPACVSACLFGALTLNLEHAR